MRTNQAVNWQGEASVPPPVTTPPTAPDPVRARLETPAETQLCYQWHMPDVSVEIARNVEGCDLYACPDLPAMAAMWRKFQHHAYCTPYQAFDWIEQWFDNAADKGRVHPYVVMVFEGGILRLLAPLCVEHRQLANPLAWMAQEINDYNSPLVDLNWLDNLPKGRAETIWRRIIGSAHGADYVHLTRQPALLGDRLNPFQGDQAESFSSSAHYLTLQPNWAEFYPSIRSSKSRRRLKDKLNKLRKQGAFRIRQLRQADEKAQGIRQALAWKTAQLDRTGGRNPFGDGQTESVLIGLAQTRAAQDLVRVYALEVDGEAVAVSIALARGGELNIYITAYDETKFSQCSPGTLMMVKLIELAARSGYRKFDLSIGDEAYKADWCDGLMEMSFHTQANTIMGLPFAKLARWRVLAKRFIKSKAGLFTALQRLNARWIAWRNRGQQLKEQAG